MEFASATREMGATMRINNGSLLRGGERAYVVGGHPARGGGQVPSMDTPTADVHAGTVADQHARVLRHAEPDANLTLGSWRTGDTVTWDASTIMNNRRTAVAAGRERNQIAIWDNRRMREIPTGGTGG